MVQGPDFLYFFRTESKTSYYYVDNFGNVQTTTTPKPLLYSPDAWQQISIMNERNKKYFGLDRTFTIPLVFVEDGATILKHLFYTQGAEAKASLLILEQKLFIDSTHYGFYYELLYEGEPDFTTFDNEEAKVTCNLIDGGLSKEVKANENTVYEFDLNVAQARTVEMDGLLLRSSAVFALSDETVNSSSQGYFPLAYINQEGFLKGLEFQSDFIAYAFAAPELPWFGTDIWKSKWFVHATEVTPITVSASFKLDTKAGNYFRAELVKFKESSTVGPVSYTVLDQQDFTDYTSSQVSGVNFDYAVTLQPGEYLSLIFRKLNRVGDPLDATIHFIEGELKIVSKAKQPPSYPKCVTALYLYQQLINAITEGKYTGDSALLAQRTDLLITCGDALRGFPNAKIKTSLSQFFNSINSLSPIGMGPLKGQMILEEREFWFNGDVIDLGEVSDLKRSCAAEFLYNTIKIGSPNQTYDNVNGRDEPNTTAIWRTPITSKTAELNLVSDYRYDMYGIEFQRINLEGKTTTDNSGDNDTFILQVNKTPLQFPASIISNFPSPGVTVIPGESYYTLDRTLNATATGLIDPPSAFNLGLSPKRALLSHGWFIHSFLDKQDNKWIRFQTTDKNADLIAGGIVEKDDIMVGLLPAEKFIPVLLEFETKVPDNYQQLLNDNPIRKYTATYQGVRIYGIALKSGIEPSTNKAQIFQLLATPDNTLQDFIKMIE